MNNSAEGNAHKTLSRLATITSISGSLTAVLAFAFSVYTGYVTWYHDYLSVKPVLQIISQTDSKGESVNGLILSNEGVGTALVKSVKIKFNKKLMGEFKAGWDNVRKQLGSPYWIGASDRLAIRAGVILPIFYVTQTNWKHLPEPDRQKFYNALEQIEVDIDYESIYGDGDQCRFAPWPQAGDN
jgi:hypothetical protein